MPRSRFHGRSDGGGPDHPQLLHRGECYGDVYLDGNFRGNTECTLSMGDLELYTGEPIDDYGLDMHLSMGELTLNGSEQRPVMTSPGGPHSLKVTSDMGDVRVEFGG